MCHRLAVQPGANFSPLHPGLNLPMGALGWGSSSKRWPFSGSWGRPGVQSGPAIVCWASRPAGCGPSTARPSLGRKCRYLQEMQDKAWEGVEEGQPALGAQKVRLGAGGRTEGRRPFSHPRTDFLLLLKGKVPLPGQSCPSPCRFPPRLPHPACLQNAKAADLLLLREAPGSSGKSHGAG